VTESLTTPRILLSAPASGSGKTTFSIAFLAALKKRGLHVACFKCGPDYIDPMFHERALGVKSRNLDLYMLSEPTARYLAARSAEGADFAYIEGVMGYYDGLGIGDAQASSAHLANALQTPSVLLVDATGMSTSVLAMLKGFVEYAPNTIAGVVFNNISEAYYTQLSGAVEAALPLRCYGYLPHMASVKLESRHLGLVTAQEVENLAAILEALAGQAEESIDIDGLIALGASAGGLDAPRPDLSIGSYPVRIAVARDEAFCFYYEDSLDLLKEMGAEIAEFSPIRDACLPEGTDGVYLGGGYPELYLEALSGNVSMLASLRGAAESGMPIYAECGGFMYLHESVCGLDGRAWPLAGLVAGSCSKQERLVRFGYAEIEAVRESVIAKPGMAAKVHEFHYYESTNPGDAFLARRRNAAYPCGYTYKNVLGGFPHLHFYANPNFAHCFLTRALAYRESRKGTQTI